MTVLARCLDTHGQPIRGIRVTAKGISEGPYDAISGPDGRVRLVLSWRPVVNGHWISVEATGDGWTHIERREQAAKGSAIHDLGALTLVPAGTVRGIVRNADGRPATGARVWVVGGTVSGTAAIEEERRVKGSGYPDPELLGATDALVLRSTTNARGEYRLSVPSGSVSIVARLRGCECSYTDPIGVRNREAVRVPDLILRRLKPANMISGFVHGADGQPLPGARVRVFAN